MTDHEVSYAHPTGSPVELRVEWPQRLSHFAVAASVFIAVIAGGAIFGAVDAVRQGDRLIAAGATVFAVMITVVTGISIRLAGFRWVSRSSRISAQETENGVGACIPTGRTTPVLVAALACCAALGIGACVALYLGIGESASPGRLDDDGGAFIPGVYGAVALLCVIFFLTFRSPAVLRLTPSGVGHRVRRHRGFRRAVVDDFAAWSDIRAITPETYTVNTGQSPIDNPQVRVTYWVDVPSETDSAPERDFLIQAHLMVAEPNTLYSLMIHMHEYPEDRHLLAREDSVRLLTPPPLRERFRTAREVKKSEKLARSVAPSNTYRRARS